MSSRQELEAQIIGAATNGDMERLSQLTAALNELNNNSHNSGSDAAASESRPSSSFIAIPRTQQQFAAVPAATDAAAAAQHGGTNQTAQQQQPATQSSLHSSNIGVVSAHRFEPLFTDTQQSSRSVANEQDVQRLRQQVMQQLHTELGVTDPQRVVSVFALGNAGRGKSHSLNALAGTPNLFLHRSQAKSCTDGVEFACVPLTNGSDALVIFNLPGLIEALPENIPRNERAIDAAMRCLPDARSILLFVSQPQNGRLPAEDVECFGTVVRYLALAQQAAAAVGVVVNSVQESLLHSSEWRRDIKQEIIVDLDEFTRKDFNGSFRIDPDRICFLPLLSIEDKQNSATAPAAQELQHTLQRFVVEKLVPAAVPLSPPRGAVLLLPAQRLQKDADQRMGEQQRQHEEHAARLAAIKEEGERKLRESQQRLLEQQERHRPQQQQQHAQEEIVVDFSAAEHQLQSMRPPLPKSICKVIVFGVGSNSSTAASSICDFLRGSSQQQLQRGVQRTTTTAQVVPDINNDGHDPLAFVVYDLASLSASNHPDIFNAAATHLLDVAPRYGIRVDTSLVAVVPVAAPVPSSSSAGVAAESVLSSGDATALNSIVDYFSALLPARNNNSIVVNLLVLVVITTVDNRAQTAMESGLRQSLARIPAASLRIDFVRQEEQQYVGFRMRLAQRVFAANFTIPAPLPSAAAGSSYENRARQAVSLLRFNTDGDYSSSPAQSTAAVGQSRNQNIDNVVRSYDEQDFTSEASRQRREERRRAAAAEQQNQAALLNQERERFAQQLRQQQQAADAEAARLARRVDQLRRQPPQVVYVQPPPRQGPDCCLQ